MPKTNIRKYEIAMKFADFMCESAICVDIKATDKIGVIQELVSSLVSIVVHKHKNLL